MSSTRVLLVDDHALFRSGLRMVLESEIDGAIVEEAGSVSEALTDRASPSIVLLDIKLPGLNGIDGIVRFTRAWPRVPVLILSSHAEPAVIERALAQGARAYIHKAESVPQMMAIVRAVLRDEPPRPTSIPPSGTRPRLTPRQLEVLELLCEGLPNRQIGKRLGLSENTVRGHVQSLLFALGVASRSEAIVVARRDDWVGD